MNQQLKMPVNITDDLYDQLDEMQNFSRENADREEMELDLAQAELDSLLDEKESLLGNN